MAGCRQLLWCEDDLGLAVALDDDLAPFAARPSGATNSISVFASGPSPSETPMSGSIVVGTSAVAASLRGQDRLLNATISPAAATRSATPLQAASQMARAVSAVRALSSAASRYTSPMELPGRMSWNWSKSRFSHAASNWPRSTGTPAHRCHETSDLGFAQRQLVPPIGPLDLAVCRVGAAMRLQIELSHPGREIRSQGTGIRDQRAVVRHG